MGAWGLVEVLGFGSGYLVDFGFAGVRFPGDLCFLWVGVIYISGDLRLGCDDCGVWCV